MLLKKIGNSPLYFTNFEFKLAIEDQNHMDTDPKGSIKSIWRLELLERLEMKLNSITRLEDSIYPI